MSSWETIQAEVRADRIGLLTLNRPALRNPISIQMRMEISACLGAWRKDSRVGAVVVTGAGAAFSAGFDLKEFRQPERLDALFETSARYHRDVWTFPKPIIAAVNGVALAGGFDLAKLCDIRICTANAVFGHPEIKFGSPTLYTPLRWIVGDGLARDLCLTGRHIDAREAHRIGFVSEIAADGELLDRAVAIGAVILEAPLETVLLQKRLMTDHEGRGMEASFRIEHDEAFRALLDSFAARSR